MEITAHKSIEKIYRKGRSRSITPLKKLRRSSFILPHNYTSDVAKKQDTKPVLHKTSIAVFSVWLFFGGSFSLYVYYRHRHYSQHFIFAIDLCVSRSKSFGFRFCYLELF